jgi:outer membrane protein TolC
LITLRQRIQRIALAAALGLLAGCKAPLLTTSNGVELPIPPGLERAGEVRGAATCQPFRSEYLAPGRSHLDLTPMRVIHLTFENAPRIRVAYLKYLSEKSRYDYILATWTSTTPGAAVGPGWERSVDITDTISNRQTQRVEVFLERNFLDTSRLRAFGGVLNEDDGDAHGFHPNFGGLFHFPLWVSRDALQRTSDQIFQQNRVNDAQLAYVREVRTLLSNMTGSFFGVLGIGQRVEARQHYVEDLEAILQRVQAAASRPAATQPATTRSPDAQRVQAEITTAVTGLRSEQSNYAIELDWMTSTMGLPHELEVALIEEPFDPFGDASHDELLALSLRTDPEIETLKNAVKDSQVQLALARKGRLDVAVDIGAAADLRGSGYWTGQTEYQANAALTVSFIDPRLSTSLAREASANIARYQQAIERRHKEVYVEAMEPMIKARSLRRNIPEIRRNLERYRQDFHIGLQDYFAGRMDIDDLLRRRQSLLDEEFDLINSKSALGGRMASLAGATGKYFELLQQPAPTPRVLSPQSAPASRPATTPADSQTTAIAPPAVATEILEEVSKSTHGRASRPWHPENDVLKLAVPVLYLEQENAP